MTLAQQEQWFIDELDKKVLKSHGSRCQAKGCQKCAYKEALLREQSAWRGKNLELLHPELAKVAKDRKELCILIRREGRATSRAPDGSKIKKAPKKTK